MFHSHLHHHVQKEPQISRKHPIRDENLIFLYHQDPKLFQRVHAYWFGHYDWSNNSSMPIHLFIMARHDGKATRNGNIWCIFILRYDFNVHMRRHNNNPSTHAATMNEQPGNKVRCCKIWKRTFPTHEHMTIRPRVLHCIHQTKPTTLCYGGHSHSGTFKYFFSPV